MDLKPFVARPVAAGEPITAQAWNDLVEGIHTLNEYVRNSQATALRVKLGNTDILLSSVRITARRDDGWLMEAIAPVNGNAEFVFAALPQGAFTIRAEAPGFKPTTASVTIPTSETLQLTLGQSGAFMPNLIGVELATALSMLEDSSIIVGRLLDVVGRELPPSRPDAEYASQPVLMQLPDPGIAVAPEGKVQLVVSAALQAESSVEVPVLTGLTQSEARKALEAIGLKLGKTDIRSGK